MSVPRRIRHVFVCGFNVMEWLCNLTNSGSIGTGIGTGTGTGIGTGTGSCIGLDGGEVVGVIG